MTVGGRNLVDPDAWSVSMPDRRSLTGREFAEQYPGFDHTLLPPSHVGSAIRLVWMVERGRDPVTRDAREIPPAS